MPRILAAALAGMALGVAGTSGVVAAINDYPTAASADYGFRLHGGQSADTQQSTALCVFNRYYRIYLGL